MNNWKMWMAAGVAMTAWTGSAAWQYVAVGAAGSSHPDKAYITDGNWELKVVSWDARSFQTSGTWANSYLAGSGKLDLAAAQSDLGRTLSPAGHYSSATQITELVLPDDFTKCEDSFCQGCTAMTKISGGKPTTIGNDAFSGCTALETFDMDLSEVTSIGDRAFNGITKIVFDFNLPVLTTLGQRPFTVNGGGNPCQVRTFRAPLLKAVPYRAFWNVTTLTTVEVSPELTSIGEQAFSGCSSLASLSPALIPTTLSATAIGGSAFLGCSALAQPMSIAEDSDGTVTFSLNAFSGAGFTKLDMSQSKCNFDNLRSFRDCNQITEVWFSPAQTNLLPWTTSSYTCNIFGSGLRRFYFTGVAPDFATMTSYLTSGCPDYQITAYADPRMDEKWRPATVTGYRALTADEITLLEGDDYPDAKAAYAAGFLLGTWQTNGSARMWFVRYTSPLRKLRGLAIIMR